MLSTLGRFVEDFQSVPLRDGRARNRQKNDPLTVGITFGDTLDFPNYPSRGSSPLDSPDSCRSNLCRH
jgi:hypothetical protein